ncbi:MAG: cell division protein SepF [Christensenellales bacterium]|jgi:cell division inhibitor SepF
MGIFGKMRDYFFEDPEDSEFNDDTTEDAASVQQEVKLPEFEKVNDQPRQRAKVVPMSNSNPVPSAIPSGVNMKMIVYQPMSYEDAQNIVDNLRARKPVIVNMVDLERECAQRVVDFIAGAVYALNGTIRKVSFGIFVIVPSNVALVGNGEEETETNVRPQ